ncbi:MAG: HD-GYP domain-containing protein [Clostridia bacterium]|nr:HD-GYP domain-containing protein [Clostridia bacterium]
MKPQQILTELIGCRIKSPIYSNEGHLLLKQGTVIDTAVLSKLERHSISPLDLLNKLTKDIPVKGVLDDQEMEKSLKVVKKVFENVLNNHSKGIGATIPDEHLKLVEEVINFLIESLTGTGDLLYTVSDMLENEPYTYKHSINVSILSVLTAKALKYGTEEIKNIALGAFLHDIGKMLVDQSLITKPDLLTSAEKELVNQHPKLGYELIKNIDKLPYTAKQIVLLHHEKLDGSGYPYSIKGIEIPEYVRIVTICDMYDAMTTNRVYRNKMPIYKVLELLMHDAVYKLDRKVYRYMIENICVFPPGSGVVLSDGRIGVVAFYRTANPTRPHVRVIDLETDITDIKVETVNLERKRTLFVADTWDVHEFRKGFKATPGFGELPHRSNDTVEQKH